MKQLHPHLCLFASLVFLSAAGCVPDSADGNCGPVLSGAECEIVKVQLGALADVPPPDPTNRFAQGAPGGTDGPSMDEENAYQLGRYLFFDRCMSSDRSTACVTCHDPGAGFIDSRPRAVTVSATFMNAGMPVTMRLPAVQDATGANRPLSPALLTVPPPDVTPQLDDAGAPLAVWDPVAMTWKAVVRRAQASQGSHDSLATGFTGRNAPPLYNLSYGAGAPAADGSRTYGATWGPLDGRYDSMWSLVADVYEFAGVQRSNRAHVALRVYRQHSTRYEAAFGGPMPNLDATDINGKRLYPMNASPSGVFQSWKDCWNGVAGACPADTLTPSQDVKDSLNQIFVNSGKALAAYMRRLRSGNSPYDKWLKDPTDPAGMSVAAQRGLRLFIGKGECVLCHIGPNFTDWRFHNLGVPSTDPEGHISGSAVPPVPAGGYPSVVDCFNPGSVPKPGCPDQGRYAWQNRLAGRCEVLNSCQKTDTTSCLGSGGVYNDSGNPLACLPPLLFDRCTAPTQDACSKDGACQWETTDMRCVPRPTATDLGAFKTPSLRNVARTWPYMHNGALSDFGPAEAAQVSPTDPAADPTPHLTRVVEFYNQGGGTPAVGTKDPIIHPLHLEPTEVADLVEFLKNLTDESAGAAEPGVDPDPIVDNPNPTDMNPMGTCPP